MPFTASHPAAVLPLVRCGLVPSALVVGSMVPDLPYFLLTPSAVDVTHSLQGLVTVDIALGLGALLVWEVLLRPAAVALAPAGLRARLSNTATVPWLSRFVRPRAAMLVLVSLVLGAATHVAWDSFTHPGGWGASRFDWLAAEHGPLHGIYWAQLVSSLFGAAVLLVWFVGWWRRTPPSDPSAGRWAPSRPTRLAALTAVLVATATGALLGSLSPLLEEGGPDLWMAAFHALTRGGLAGTVAAVLAALVLRVLRRRSWPEDAESRR